MPGHLFGCIGGTSPATPVVVAEKSTLVQHMIEIDSAVIFTTSGHFRCLQAFAQSSNYFCLLHRAARAALVPVTISQYNAHNINTATIVFLVGS